MINNIQKGFTLIELMIVVAIIGILAAVAIPAYGDYTARAQAAEAFTLMDGFKTPLTEMYTSSGEFGIAPGYTGGVTGITSGKYVASVTTPTANPFSVVATFKAAGSGPSSKIASKSVHMYYNPNTGSWTCNNGDAANDDTTAIASVDPTVPTPASTVVANSGATSTVIPASILPKSCG